MFKIRELAARDGKTHFWMRTGFRPPWIFLPCWKWMNGPFVSKKWRVCSDTEYGEENKASIRETNRPLESVWIMAEILLYYTTALYHCTLPPHCNSRPSKCLKFYTSLISGEQEFMPKNTLI